MDIPSQTIEPHPMNSVDGTTFPTIPYLARECDMANKGRFTCSQARPSRAAAGLVSSLVLAGELSGL